MPVQFMVTLQHQHQAISGLTTLDTVGSYQITEDTDNNEDFTDSGDDDDSDNEVFSDVTGPSWWSLHLTDKHVVVAYFFTLKLMFNINNCKNLILGRLEA